MTNSTVTLRIQELAEAQKKLLEELSDSDLSIQTIQAYATAPVELTEKTASDLRKIATKLQVPVVELVKPVVTREVVKLKIIELAEGKQLSLEQLSNQSSVDLAIICFYSTQPIEKKKLYEPQFQANLTKISKALECSILDLQDTNKVDLPPTRLRIEEVAKDKDLTLEDLSMLTGTTAELINLIAKNPVDIEALEADIWQDPALGRVIRIIKNILDIRR